MASYVNSLGGFNITTASSIDRRLILSKNEMLTLKYDDLDPKTGKQVSIKVPDIYFALCKDNNKMYVFIRRSEAEKDPETGWFCPLEDVLDFNISEEAQEKFNEAVNNSDLSTIVGDDDSGLVKKVNDIEDKIETIEINGGIVGGDE